jgi:hypothetical protein
MSEEAGRGEFGINYGSIERDEETRSVGLVGYGFDGRPFAYWEKPLRRRRYETWIENGRKMGRWTWEYLP